MASFAQRELMKYPETTRDLQYFLNTTCVDILRAQSPETGPCRGRWGWPGIIPCSRGSSLESRGSGWPALVTFSPLLQASRAAGRTPRWRWV